MILFLLVLCFYTPIPHKTAEKPIFEWFSTQVVFLVKMNNTPIQEHSIFDYDGDNGLNLLILVSITFPENFIVLNELDQKAYWVWNSKKYGK